MSGSEKAVKDFAVAMRNYLRTDNTDMVRAAAMAVMRETRKAILVERHPSETSAHGLAIYFPDPKEELDGDYQGSYIDFTSDTQWDEFLIEFFGLWRPDLPITNSCIGNIGKAREKSQAFGKGDQGYVDLYDFCQKLFECMTPPPPGIIVDPKIINKYILYPENSQYIIDTVGPNITVNPDIPPLELINFLGPPIDDIKEGQNIIKIMELNSRGKPYTSRDLLSDSGNSLTTVHHYDSKKGSLQSTYSFFGKVCGSEFSMSPIP